MNRMTFRRESLLSVVFVLSGSLLCFSQNPSPGQTPAPATPTPPASGTNRSNRPTNPGTAPEVTRPIFLSGDVKLPDGSNPPGRVVIERVCGASIRPEGYTDSTGHFSFLVSNQNSALFFDASVSGEGLTARTFLGHKEHQNAA